MLLLRDVAFERCRFRAILLLRNSAAGWCYYTVDEWNSVQCKIWKVSIFHRKKKKATLIIRRRLSPTEKNAKLITTGFLIRERLIKNIIILKLIRTKLSRIRLKQNTITDRFASGINWLQTQRTKILNSVLLFSNVSSLRSDQCTHSFSPERKSSTSSTLFSVSNGQGVRRGTPVG